MIARKRLEMLCSPLTGAQPQVMRVVINLSLFRVAPLFLLVYNALQTGAYVANVRHSTQTAPLFLLFKLKQYRFPLIYTYI